MNKKAAIELSMNFLVVIILSIVIVGVSAAIIIGIASKSYELSAMTQDDLNNRIEALNCNQKVCFSSNYQMLSRGGYHVFGLRVFNEHDTDKLFTITAKQVSPDENASFLYYVPKEYNTL